MSDDNKPKGGLDLAKLLAKKKPQQGALPTDPPSDPAESPRVETQSAEPDPKEPKAALDVGKLLAKAKQKSEPPKASEPAPQESALASPTTPTTSTPTTPALDLLFAKPAVAPVVAKPAPPPKPVKKPEPPKTVRAASGDALAHVPSKREERVDSLLASSVTPFTASVEQKASREGAKDLRLDVTVAEELKYPLGFFGVDEVHAMGAYNANVIRRNLWRVKDRYPNGFRIALRVVGAVFANGGITWSPGEPDATVLVGQLPQDPMLTVTIDAESLIKTARGTEGCEAQFARAPGKYEGDVDLLFWLGLDLRAAFTAEMIAGNLERENNYYELLRRTLKNAKDQIDAFCAYVELMTRDRIPWRENPVFMRAFFDTSPRTEVLYHFEAGKLTILRGKPGESLVQGALELHVDQVAMRALHEGEASLYFLMTSCHVKLTGDPQVFREVGLYEGEGAIKSLRHVMESGAPISWENRRFIKPVLEKPAKDPYAWIW